MQRKFGDPYKMLLALRTTPIETRFSPAELLIGKKLKGILSVAPKCLKFIP